MVSGGDSYALCSGPMPKHVFCVVWGILVLSLSLLAQVVQLVSFVILLAGSFVGG
jgi:hypothetical protein